MPVRQVGKDCYQWGNQKKYCGPDAKQKAILQGIAIENTGWKEAEYQPNQTLEDYDDEGLTHSSAIDGYQPFKYSVMTSRAETFEAESKEEKRLKKYEKTYGEEGAKVRNRIFKRILAKSQDGTKAGQWSARKAQSLTEDYEKAMAKKNKRPYKSSKKTKSQKSLKDWGDQDWKTKSGKKSSKTGERYLPAKAIDALTDEEYKKTSSKKRTDSKKGKQFSKQPSGIAKKVAQYRAELESKPYRVVISRSTNDAKKLMAVFYDGEDKKIKTTHFGARGASDYTKHGDKERMGRYLERHGGGFETSTKENWKDPTTAGALSRWILWNKPSLSSSFADYKRRFGLKGTMTVSKSAEDAKDFAREKHEGQRYGDKPYMTHVEDVVSGFEDAELREIAYLHDVVEDSDVTIEEIHERFGEKVGRAVDALTRRKETYFDYIRRVKENPAATKVKLADLNANLKNNPNESLEKRYRKAIAMLTNQENEKFGASSTSSSNSSSPITRRGYWRKDSMVPIFCGMLFAAFTFRNR
ncbi:MAG: DUF5754 family protein [Candidatus Thorarchaeota archaeon]